MGKKSYTASTNTKSSSILLLSIRLALYVDSTNSSYETSNRRRYGPKFLRGGGTHQNPRLLHKYYTNISLVEGDNMEEITKEGTEMDKIKAR